MIDLLLGTLIKNGDSPITPMPSPPNPDDWGKGVGITTDNLGENIYFAGGTTAGNTYNRRVMSYNVINKTYTQYPALPATMTYTSFAQVWCKEGTIYVSRTFEMYRLNPGAQSWVKLANPSNPSNVPEYAAATLIYNGRLLCYGLLPGPGYDNTILEYLPGSNSFVRVATNPLKPIQPYCSLCVLGTKFYMFNNTNHIDIYDIATNTWSSTAKLPVQFSGSAIAAYNDKVVLFRGNSPASDVTVAYDTTTAQFSNLPTLKLPDAQGKMVTAGEYAYTLQDGKLIAYKLD